MRHRILICGGRNLNSYRVRDYLTRRFSPFISDIECIIEGDAEGADFGAQMYALDNNIDLLCFPADWEKYGKSAGPIRNKQMIDEGKPTMVVCFPGKRGTAGMEKLAKEANVPVYHIYGDFE